jgi:predicted lipid-binding transport protein (Tim44 family)
MSQSHRQKLERPTKAVGIAGAGVTGLGLLGFCAACGIVPILGITGAAGIAGVLGASAGATTLILTIGAAVVLIRARRQRSCAPDASVKRLSEDDVARADADQLTTPGET